MIGVETHVCVALALRLDSLVELAAAFFKFWPTRRYGDQRRSGASEAAKASTTRTFPSPFQHYNLYRLIAMEVTWRSPTYPASGPRM